MPYFLLCVAVLVPREGGKSYVDREGGAREGRGIGG